MMVQPQNEIENEEQVTENQQQIQENNEETSNQLTEEAKQPLQNKNDGALKSQLKRINEDQSKSETNPFIASTTQKAIETKRRLVGINRKHYNEMDENLKVYSFLLLLVRFRTCVRIPLRINTHLIIHKEINQSHQRNRARAYTFKPIIIHYQSN